MANHQPQGGAAKLPVHGGQQFRFEEIEKAIALTQIAAADGESRRCQIVDASASGSMFTMATKMIRESVSAGGVRR